MNVQQYKNFILPMLTESFDEREADNLFRFTLEDYFKKRYFDVKDYLLNDDEIEELNYIYEKITNHYPIQYIFKKADFYGLEYYVDEHVLIPRPETEELVHWIISEGESESDKDNTKNKTLSLSPSLSLLDIGTGSGCIPIAIKKNKPHWKVSATDVSESALKIAKKNAENNAVEIEFVMDDILNSTFNIQFRNEFGTSYSTFNIIVSNPPYIPLNEKDLMSPSTIQFEPHLALFVENDNPLIFYDKIADFAKIHLAQNGKLYFELNEFNANDVKALLEQKGFQNIIIKKDFAGKDRMLSATL